MTDSNYNGFRFMVDAKTSRQYALRYVNGTPQPPIDIHAVDIAESKLKPNETVFAFDDDVSKEVRDGRIYMRTFAWQMTANDEGNFGKGAQGKRCEVEYQVTFNMDASSGTVSATYTLTDESRAVLEEEGFSDDLPEQYIEELAKDDPGILRSGGGVQIKESILSSLAFPPHHGGQAAVARFNVETAAQPAPAPAPKTPVGATAANTNTPARPTKDFARTSAPATTPRTRPTLARPTIPDSAIEAVIKMFCEDLSEKAANGKLDPVVGRDSQTDQALKVMSRRKQASLCFTGDAGVGKTAMFSAVAQRLNDDPNLPESLQNARVLVLDLQAMNAGAKFRGQFEERLKPLIDGLKEREGYLKGRKVILAIDEIHSQLTAGKAEGGSDAGNMMKPFLTSQGISVMGTTTADEYRKYIEKDGALSSRFEQLVIGEPEAKDTKFILTKLWPLYRDHHGLSEDLSEADIDYIVTMSNRYAPNESQPRKGEKVMSTAAASAEFRGSSKIEKEDIIAAIAQMSKLSIDFLNQNDLERFIKMEKELPEKVLGQPGIQKVVDGLVGSRSGLNDPNQPWGCFVLQGPTGTGKTELVKELARYLFGSEEAMIHLNMGEYAQEHSVARLIGAPPGYVGFDSAEPALTEKIRQRPYSIILFDEIEKAHPKIFDVLLPVLNDGKMEDNHGKTVLFNNAIIVMTTNLGAKDVMQLVKGGGNVMGFGADENDNTPEGMQKRLDKTYNKAREEFFRPEMINRIEELGGFVTWLPLTQEVISKLIDREIGKVSKRLSDNTGAGIEGISLEVSADIRAKLSKDGYNPSMGARPMRKVIREQIANPLGKWLMANKEELIAFVAKNGPAKLVIDKVGADFAPQIEKAVSNTNVATPAKPVRKKAAGPRAG